MTTQSDQTDVERMAAAAIENIINSMPVILMILDDRGAVASVNPALERVTGYTWQEIVGKRLPDQPFITDNAIEASRSMWEDHLKQGKKVAADYEVPIRDRQGNVRILLMSEVRIKDISGKDTWMYIGEDITTLKETQARLEETIASQNKAIEQATAKLEELVEAQQQTIKEISTPIIPIWTKVLMSPLLGSFDSQRMHDLSEGLLEEIARQKPRVVLLDLSGLAYVDTQVVSEIIRLVTSIKFLGSRTVLSGIGPQIAQSLVRLGVNLEGITTYATLEQALKSVVGK